MIATRMLAATFAAAALLAASTAAQGHAFLDHSDPAVGSSVPTSPPIVRLWFTQRLEAAFSSATVTDRSGATMNDGAATIGTKDRAELDVKLKPLPAGTYKVTWHVLSVDTHTTTGDFTFTVRGG